MVYYFLFVLIPLALLAAPFEVIQNQATLPLLNPSYHNEKVEKIRLENGFEAILVSNPEVKQSAVALTVLAGSWLEPDEFPGLAHFLEHMLFLGTKEYPDESSFTRFLTEHGGQTNAFTHGDYTSFMFALNTDGLEEALKRFSSFFKDPLFNPSGVSRELNAIDQEFAQGFNNEDMREYQVLKELASPLHPFSRFQTGNSQSLAKATTENLRKWFETHYSANLMRLYVLSSDPIEKIRKEVVEDFSGIPNHHLKRFQNTNALFTKQVLGHLVRIEPKNASQTLTLTWAVPFDVSLDLKSHPADLLCTAIGYEGKNSLLSSLKRDGLADGLGCGGNEIASETYLFYIEIKLTSKGIKELDTVIERVFSTIHMIEKTPFPQYLFDDYSQMLRTSYQFQQRDEPFKWAMNQSSLLSKEPIETYPELSNTIRVFDRTALNTLLTALTPENGIYILTAPGQKLSKKEKWMQIPYDIEPISEAKLKQWGEAKLRPEITYPSKNPFLAKSPKASSPLIDKDTYPALAPPKQISGTGGKIFYSQDPFYQVPRTSLLFQIQTPAIQDGTPSTVVMADLYVKVLKDHLQDLLDEAQMADLEVIIEKGFGNLQFQLDGFTESVAAFFPLFTAHLHSLELSQDKFEQLKSLLIRDYENNITASPVKQAFDEFKGLVFENYTTFDQKRASIEQVTFTDFQKFQSSLFDKIYVRGVITGSLTEQEAKQLTLSLPTSLASPYYPKIKGIEGPSLYRFKTKAEGEVMLLGVEMEPFTPQNRNIQDMLSQAISEAFFAELRTKQQTGYIVFSDSLEAQKHLFNLFAVQSTTHTPLELLFRFELFLANYVEDLSKTISKARFETLKASIEKQLKTPPANLKLFAEQNFRLAFEFEDFGWLVKRLGDLSTLTYENFIETSKAFLSRSNSKRLAIALRGQYRDLPPLEYKEK